METRLHARCNTISFRSDSYETGKERIRSIRRNIYSDNLYCATYRIYRRNHSTSETYLFIWSIKVRNILIVQAEVLPCWICRLVGMMQRITSMYILYPRIHLLVLHHPIPALHYHHGLISTRRVCRWIKLELAESALVTQ